MDYLPFWLRIALMEMWEAKYENNLHYLLNIFHLINFYIQIYFRQSIALAGGFPAFCYGLTNADAAIKS